MHDEGLDPYQAWSSAQRPADIRPETSFPIGDLAGYASEADAPEPTAQRTALEHRMNHRIDLSQGDSSLIQA
jgi:hypothetical protein